MVGSAAATIAVPTAAGNLSFDINLNGDGAQTVTVLAGIATNAALATAIQNAVRALTPADPFRTAAYTGFTASVNASGVFTFTSGLAGATANSTASTGVVAITANGADTLAANLNMLAGTSTTGTNFTLSDPTGSSNFRPP